MTGDLHLNTAIAAMLDRMLNEKCTDPEHEVGFIVSIYMPSRPDQPPDFITNHVSNHQDLCEVLSRHLLQLRGMIDEQQTGH